MINITHTDIDIIVKKTGYLLECKHKQCKDSIRINEITLLFHNGSKFDLRLVIKRLAEKCKTNQISCIAQSKETFYSLIIHNFDNRNIRLRFIDCSRHLPFSLDR